MADVLMNNIFQLILKSALEDGCLFLFQYNKFDIILRPSDLICTFFFQISYLLIFIYLTELLKNALLKIKYVDISATTCMIYNSKMIK